MDCIGYVKEAWEEISVSTLNASWSKLLPEFDMREKSLPEENRGAPQQSADCFKNWSVLLEI